MKKTNINLMKIIAATSVCIFSLFSVFAGTSAWFLSNQNYDGSGNQFTINGQDPLTVTTELYRYDQERKVGIEDTSGSLALNPYDTFLVSRNAFNSLYLKLNLVFLMPTDANHCVRLKATCSSGYLDNESHVLKASSNIIYFSSLLVSSTNESGTTTTHVDGVDFSTADRAYNTSKAAFGDGATKYTFVNGNPLAKSAMSIALNANTGIVLPANTVNATILLKYDYSTALVENFIENSGESSWGSGVLTDEVITFSADISSLEIQYD